MAQRYHTGTHLLRRRVSHGFECNDALAIAASDSAKKGIDSDIARPMIKILNYLYFRTNRLKSRSNARATAAARRCPSGVPLPPRLDGISRAKLFAACAVKIESVRMHALECRTDALRYRRAEACKQRPRLAGAFYGLVRALFRVKDDNTLAI